MSLIFDIKVIPCSGKQKCIVDKSGVLKFYLKSQPEKGAANQELIKLIAKTIGITQSEVEIVVGLTNNKKKIRINKNITYEQLLEELDALF